MRDPGADRSDAGTRQARAGLAVAVVALVGVLLLAVFPARTLVAQRQERARTAARLARLEGQNRRLDDQVRLLQTDGEIERLARRHYNLVRPGEEVFAVLPPAAPTARPLPPGRPALPPHRGPWWRATMRLLTNVF